MFDSWGGQLPPREWDRWSGPYLKRMIAAVKARHPRVPLTLYANGRCAGGMGGGGARAAWLEPPFLVAMTHVTAPAHHTPLWGLATCTVPHPPTPPPVPTFPSGGLLERLGATGADVIGLDWTVDMADARRRLGPGQSVQGNVDPVVLFAEQSAIEAAVRDVLVKAGPKGHILNLGHGVLVGTPEDAVAHMFELSKRIKYADLAAQHAAGQQQPALVP